MNRLLSLHFWIPESSGLRLAEKLRSALAASLAMRLVGWIGARFGAGNAAAIMVASMGATAVIVFAVPNSPMARPWAMVGGHLLSGSIGLLCAQWHAGPWVTGAAAVGLSILAMHLSRCLHPPGGASALIPTLGGPAVQAPGIGFLLMPLALNLVAMLAALLLFQALRGRAPAHAAETRAAPPPLERLGLRAEDLHAAVLEMNAFVDISEDDLGTLYQLAAGHAKQREPGGITCADIMTREVLAVEFGEDLETTWRLLQQPGVRAIPVIGRGRHVPGMITLPDFLRHAPDHGVQGLGDRLRRLLRRTPDVTSNKPEVAGQIMGLPAATAREDTPVADIAGRLAAGIREIAIVDAHGQLTGLLTQSDPIGAMHRTRLVRLRPHPTAGDSGARDAPAAEAVAPA